MPRIKSRGFFIKEYEGTINENGIQDSSKFNG